MEEKEIYKEIYIASNLKKLRKSKNLTIKQLATKIDLAESTIENIEDKITDKNQLNTIVKISNYFNVKIHDFVYKEF